MQKIQGSVNLDSEYYENKLSNTPPPLMRTPRNSFIAVSARAVKLRQIRYFHSILNDTCLNFILLHFRQSQ